MGGNLILRLLEVSNANQKRSLPNRAIISRDILFQLQAKEDLQHSVVEAMAVPLIDSFPRVRGV